MPSIRRTVRRKVRREVVLVAGQHASHIALSTDLKLDGFGVVSCSLRALTGRSQEVKPDVIVLEARNHLLDAAETCRALRRLCSTPIVVLGMCGDDDLTVARILESGADDHLREPSGSTELVARVKAVLRRAKRWETKPAAISVGPLRIEQSQHTAFLDGAQVALSPTEYLLLSYLIRHPNRVIAHEDLLSRVWGMGCTESQQVLRVTVSRLRRKIGADKHRDIRIEAISGCGYRLAVEATSIGLTV